MQTPALLSDPVYHDEDAARAYIEQVRWPDFVTCPLCGSVEKISQLGGESMGPGWWYCGACKGKFTVRVGMIFGRSHIPLHKWLMALRLMASSKKGVSAHQLHRTLGITYKSAWSLGHRIREAMSETGSAPLGGEGAFVEADETYVGGRARNRAYKAPAPKKAVVSLVERSGRVRSQHVPEVNAANLRPILEAGIDKASHLRTDESGVYWESRREVREPSYRQPFGERVRARRRLNRRRRELLLDPERGIYGTYQHVSEEHLHRYLAEFDFRHNNRVKLGIGDAERTRRAIVGAEGKRLTYRRTRSQEAAAPTA
jgi:transposase-like protein